MLEVWETDFTLGPIKKFLCYKHPFIASILTKQTASTDGKFQNDLNCPYFVYTLPDLKIFKDISDCTLSFILSGACS